ncbi:hypothetical protein [Egbenema bharatensis]|uniref:hypothetical protein n=1 Tax=Egbenema bharatensis TaxID=3463334 RepID=UPI003A83B5CF
MRHRYRYSHHDDIHLFELIAVCSACILSITILYQIFVSPNWHNLKKISDTLSWTSLIR